ncbi:MAG: lipoyl protein ligase domain-containing protein [Akkermansia sp.]
MSGFANVVGNLSPLPELVLWRDPVARSGEEAMAVDEALLEWGEKPVLRAYRWAEPTVTYGYFDEEATARAIFPGEELHFVRRWTGGGIVDHRQDIPFTLAMHRKGERASFQRGFVPLDPWGAGPRPEGLRGGVRDAGRGCPGRRAGLFFQPRNE